MGEREGIDKERAEIGHEWLVEWGCRAQKIMFGHGLLRRCATRVSAVFRKQVLAHSAEQIQDENNDDDGADDAEPAACAPARVTVIAAATGEQKGENDDQKKHVSSLSFCNEKSATSKSSGHPDPKSIGRDLSYVRRVTSAEFRDIGLHCVMRIAPRNGYGFAERVLALLETVASAVEEISSAPVPSIRFLARLISSVVLQWTESSTPPLFKRLS